MPDTAKVSVTMATYCGARFIGEQLRSLKEQTLAPHEVIVSDDGSTDDTLAIAAAFAATAPFPVRIVRNPARLGYGANFLSAARLATGDVVAFCDQDDVWRPDKIQAAVTSLRESGADLHVHAADVIDDAGAPTGRFDQGIGRARTHEPLTLPPWGVYYGFSMTMRTDLLTAMDPARRGRHTFDFHGDLSHDLWAYFLATSLGRVATDPRPLAAYRRHAANETPGLDGRLIDRLSAWLGVKADPGLRRDEIAADRAKTLWDLAALPNHRLAPGAARAASRWERIAAHEAMRMKVYGEGATATRTGALARLALSGGYAPAASGGLGLKLMAKDAITGAMGLKRNRAAPECAAR